MSNEGGSLDDNYKIDNIRLTMFGRVIVGEEGQDDDASELGVLSDMQLILLDFLNYFHQNHGQEYVTDKSASLEHFTERTNDRTAGYSTVLELRQFYDWDKCSIPQSGASIPPTIDGLTLYDFCDQSVIDRLTPSQIACLEAEFGGADATVNVNSSLFDTVTAGGTLNVPVQYENGTPIGTITGGVVEIPNPLSAPTLTISVYSDAGHTTPITSADFGDTVYVKAVASNITPTTYYLYKDNGIVSCLPVTNGTGEFTYVVDLYGTIDLAVIATDVSNGVADSEPFELTVAELFPPDIAGCELWINADRLDTYTFNGVNVSQQDDLSGNGNDISAPTVSNEPLYLDTGVGINSLRSVKYEGTEYQVATGLSLDIVTGNSVFIVVQFHSSDTGGIWSNSNAPTSSSVYSFLQQNGLNVRTYNATASFSSMYAISLNTTYLIEVHNTTTSEDLVINGVSQHSRSNGTSGTRNNFYLNASFGGYGSCTIADIDVHNGILTPSEISDIRDYLTNKWDI